MLLPGGAHFENLKKGDIVFSASQTADLIKHGQISGHGKIARANGTVSNVINYSSAFAGGSGGGSFVGGATGSSSGKDMSKAVVQTEKAAKAAAKSAKSSSDASDAAKSAAEALQEQFSALFDHFEIWLDRETRRIDREVDLADSLSMTGYRDQNKHLSNAIAYNTNYIKVMTDAFQMYMKQAEASGLPTNWQNVVKNGEVRISSITDEYLRAQIEEYQKWYEKALDVQDRITEANEQILELYNQELENIANAFEGFADKIESEADIISSTIELFKERGWDVEESQYQDLINYQGQIKNNLAKEYDQLFAEFTSLVRSGVIKEGSEQWTEWQIKLNEIKGAMIDAETEIAKIRKEIIELRWANFNRAQDAIDNFNQQIETAISLMDGMDSFDEKGNLTDAGITKLGLYMQQLESAKQATKNYQYALQKIEEEYKNGVISQSEYNEKINEYREYQWQAAEATKAAKEAILSLIEQGIDKETEAYQEVIDKQKEQLRLEDESRKHKNELEEKQKKIYKIQKQLNAMANDDTAETAAKRKELEQELADAKKDLDDWYYEHSLEQQEDALDQASEDFTQAQEDRKDKLHNDLEYQNQEIEKYLAKAKDNYSTVFDQLEALGSEYGMTMTDELTKPWESAESALQDYLDALKQIGDFTPDADIDTGKIPGVDVGGDAEANHKGAGWEHENGQWKYKDTNGEYAKDTWKKIDDIWYKFDKNGVMERDKWVKQGEDYYWLKYWGGMAAGQWYEIDGKYYYFDRNGKMLHDQYIKDKNQELYYWVNKWGMWDPQWNTTKPEPGYKITKYGYAKGTTSVPKSDMYRINERGDELVLHADRFGDLSYLTQGSGVITADYTRKLMNLAKFTPDRPQDIQNIFAGSHSPAGSLNNIATDNHVEFNAPMVSVHGSTNDELVKEFKKIMRNEVGNILYGALPTKWK